MEAAAHQRIVPFVEAARGRGQRRSAERAVEVETVAGVRRHRIDTSSSKRTAMLSSSTRSRRHAEPAAGPPAPRVNDVIYQAPSTPVVTADED